VSEKCIAHRSASSFGLAFDTGRDVFGSSRIRSRCADDPDQEEIQAKQSKMEKGQVSKGPPFETRATAGVVSFHDRYATV
jgi:hypothetical protein